ncbi:hypothetical protein ACF0H5_016883 [Mactra antiquata]
MVSSQLLKFVIQVRYLKCFAVEIQAIRCSRLFQSSCSCKPLIRSDLHFMRTYCTLRRTKCVVSKYMFKGQMFRSINDDSRSDSNSPVYHDEEMTFGERSAINTSEAGHVLSEESDTTDSVSKTVESSDYYIVQNVESFLKEMYMPLKKGYTCFHTVCPKLGKLAMKKGKQEDTLYVNSTSGYFYCNHCGKSGSWLQLKDNVVYVKSKKIKKNITCFKEVKENFSSTDLIHPDIIKHFENSDNFTMMSGDTFETIQTIFDWHGIERTTFINYDVRYRNEEDKYCILFPIYSPVGRITAVCIYSGLITEDGDVKILPIQTYPRSKDKILPFGWQQKSSSRHSDNIVITSSEANAMVINQETGIMALALKNLYQLPQDVLPHLESFNKITLWLGTDIKAWENTKMFSKKLNDNRCYIFRPNMVKYMPLETLQNECDISTELDKARLISHKAILTFDYLKQEVYSEFAHYTQVAGVQWSRYTKLNQVLKGHRRGELTILTGPTGSGKTTFMAEYSLDLCMQGVCTLWGSFEISNVRLVKIMMQQYARKDITKHLDDFESIAEGFSMLPMYFMAYFGVEKIQRVLEAMSHAVYVHDISHVVVDNLQFMMGMDFTEKNRFLLQDRIISAFRQFATEKNCHVTLIIHPRKINEGEELSTSSIFGSAKATQEADNIILIQDQRLVKPSGRKYIQIAKNRFDGDMGVMTLTFNKESLTFNTVEKKKTTKKSDGSYSSKDEIMNETLGSDFE